MALRRQLSESRRSEQRLRTALQQTERQSQRNEDKHRALISALPDLIIRMTGEGVYLDFFSATTFKTFGSEANMVGRDIYAYFPRDLAELRLHHTRLALETGQFQVYEQDIQVGNELLTEEVRIVVCGDNEVLVIVRDITDRKRIEEELRKSNEELEIRVEQRTRQLRQTVHELKQEVQEREEAEFKLQQLNQVLEENTAQLVDALKQLKQSQLQLIQTEKMSSLGQLVAGVAHEINNPVNFIHGNLTHANDYAQDLLGLVNLYQQHYPNPPQEIEAEIEAIDLNFLAQDMIKLLQSMRLGTDRIREIVLSLRNFSRLDEAEVKQVNLHQGLDSTLTILQNRLKARPEHPEIQVIKEYESLPLVECYAGQLNQVFMNLISNAIDALDESHPGQSDEEIAERPGQISIRTRMVNPDWVAIQIADNGPGISAEIQSRLFDPFFTTKAVGKGTGLGLSISNQIVTEKHGGKLYCTSEPGQGTAFVIEIPVRQLQAADT
nr:ATP-binding protein [Leptolyngbya sp. 'hensonii']